MFNAEITWGRVPRGRRKRISDVDRRKELESAEQVFSSVDLLTEILLRLPAKTLCRFKLVSRLWLGIISGHQFLHRHTNRNPSPPISGVFFYHISQQVCLSFPGEESLPDLPNSPKIKIIHFCNGLLLRERGHLTMDNLTSHLIVDNPVTKKHREIPHPIDGPLSESDIYQRASSGYLAYDPSKSLDYKVVFFYTNSGHIHIYSSQSRSWKQLQSEHFRDLQLETQFTCSGGVFWNGAINWMAGTREFVQFVVDSEVLIVVRLPRTPKIRKKSRHFGENGGNLLLIQTCRRVAKGLQILAFDKDSLCWVLKYCIRLRPIMNQLPEVVGPGVDGIIESTFSVLSIVMAERQIDLMLLLCISGKIISYQLRRYKVNLLHDFNCHAHQYPVPCCDYLGAHQFVASLSPV